jgi:predicted enzyme related to lactoylglutathione lyase
VTELERARAFYRDQLGMTDGGAMAPGVLLKAGSDTIYLEGGRKPRSGDAGAEATVSICFEVDGVKSAAAALGASGVTLVMPYTEYAPTFATFRVADPDGNVLEFAGAP